MKTNPDILPPVGSRRLRENIYCMVIHFSTCRSKVFFCMTEALHLLTATMRWLGWMAGVQSAQRSHQRLRFTSIVLSVLNMTPVGTRGSENTLKCTDLHPHELFSVIFIKTCVHRKRTKSSFFLFVLFFLANNKTVQHIQHLVRSGTDTAPLSKSLFTSNSSAELSRMQHKRLHMKRCRLKLQAFTPTLLTLHNLLGI